MKLYYMPGSCALASHIALIWAGADYALHRLDHDRLTAPDFLAINPKGAVPALAIGRGAEETIITESLAILLYIADLYSDHRLGADLNDALSRARLNEILSELVSDVHKAFAPTFVPQRFAVDETAYDGARAAAHLQIDMVFQHLEQLMAERDWLVFDRRTVADAYLYVMCRWKDNTPKPLAHYPSLLRFRSKLDADEGVRRALQEEELAV
jgi:glutathione S-transferase